MSASSEPPPKKQQRKSPGRRNTKAAARPVVVVRGEYGGVLLVDHPRDVRLLDAPKRFAFLTGQEFQETYGAVLTKAMQYDALIREGKLDEAKRRFGNQRPHHPFAHQDESEYILTRHPCFESCRFRVIAAALDKDNRYHEYAFPDRDWFVQELVSAAMRNDRTQCWYPYTEYSYVVYLYLDLEENLGCATPEDERHFLQDRCLTAVRFLQVCFEGMFSVNLGGLREPARRRQAWFFTGCTEEKRSAHVHVKWLFKDIGALSSAMQYAKQVLDKLYELDPQHELVRALQSATPRKDNRWIIDFVVYNHHRKFRCAFQAKSCTATNRLWPYDIEGGKRVTLSSTTDSADEWQRWIKRTLLIPPVKKALRTRALPAWEQWQLHVQKIHQVVQERLARQPQMSSTSALVDELLTYILVVRYDENDYVATDAIRAAQAYVKKRAEKLDARYPSIWRLDWQVLLFQLLWQARLGPFDSKPMEPYAVTVALNAAEYAALSRSCWTTFCSTWKLYPRYEFAPATGGGGGVEESTTSGATSSSSSLGVPFLLLRAGVFYRLAYTYQAQKTTPLPVTARTDRFLNLSSAFFEEYDEGEAAEKHKAAPPSPLWPEAWHPFAEKWFLSVHPTLLLQSKTLTLPREQLVLDYNPHVAAKQATTTTATRASGKIVDVRKPPSASKTAGKRPHSILVLQHLCPQAYKGPQWVVETNTTLGQEISKLLFLDVTKAARKSEAPAGEAEDDDAKVNRCYAAASTLVPLSKEDQSLYFVYPPPTKAKRPRALSTTPTTTTTTTPSVPT